MSGEKKTEWILKAVVDIEKLEDQLKVYGRQIYNLNEKNKELTDENRRLSAKLEMNQTVISDDNDDNDEQQPPDADTPEKIFTPRKYREGTSTPENDQGIRKRYKTGDWRTTGRPDTPQLTGERVYKTARNAQEVRRSKLFGRPPTPPRKTRKGGKKGKTMRKYFQK
jgi:regulator of replication initiation timing